MEVLVGTSGLDCVLIAGVCRSKQLECVKGLADGTATTFRASLGSSMCRILMACWLVCLAGRSLADELQLVAEKDGTLYESATGHLANGAGTFLYAGTTGQSNNAIRRMLLSFDLGAVPTNSFVTAAELSVEVTKGASNSPADYSVHRVLKDWGEGDSNASSISQQGQGTPAADGDATWIHSESPSANWENPGGDFEDRASDTISISFENRYTWATGLVDDVQQWIDDPTKNFGWIVTGDESTARTARQFNSRTNEDVVTRPLLTVTFDVDASPLDCDENGNLDFADLDCTCLQAADEFDTLLSELGLIRGDLDGDGEVAFIDFLTLANQFGQAGTYAQGDLNCDGEVAFTDFLILAQNFGQTSQAAESVPEPTSFVLLILGLWLFHGLLSNEESKLARCRRSSAVQK